MPKKTRAIKHTNRKHAWAKRTISSKPYALESREIAKVFLIICEGVNTEPSYFKSFPLGNALVESYGLGSSKTTLVKKILQIKKEDEAVREKEIWVVFDFDIQLDNLEKQKLDYNKAINLAAQNDINVAYSNDSFELWFILHYLPLDIKWTRKEYYKKLSDLWNCNYEKAAKKIDFCRKIYTKLEEDKAASQDAAIIRADRLFEEFQDVTFADKNPCTTVHQLVKELNKYL